MTSANFRTVATASLLLIAACSDQSAPGNESDEANAELSLTPAESNSPDADPPVANEVAENAANQAGENEANAAGPADKVSACLMQDGKRISDNRLKAIGTEPFWGARIEGRCVTYSTPEDQSGTRVWTSFTGTAESGQWSGYLDKQKFVLKTRPQAGCSDGMSDRRFPIAVTLTVGGEERRGCAEPR